MLGFWRFCFCGFCVLVVIWSLLPRKDTESYAKSRAGGTVSHACPLGVFQ